MPQFDSNFRSGKREPAQYESNDTGHLESCLTDTRGVSRQREMPQNKLFGKNIDSFKHFFKRSIGCVPATDIQLSKSKPVTEKTNNEYQQIVDNISEKEEGEEEEEVIAKVKGRLDQVWIPWKCDVIELIEEMPKDFLLECLRYDTLFRGKIEDEAIWNLMLARTRNIGNRSLFSKPQWSGIIVVNVIVEALKEANKLLFDIFKSGQSPTPNEIISLIYQIDVLAKSGCFGPAGFDKKIELSIYIYWYMIINKIEFRPQNLDLNYQEIADIVESTVNMSVKGDIQSCIYKNPVYKMSYTWQNNNQSGESSIQYLKLGAPALLETEFIFGEEFEYALEPPTEEAFNKLAEKWIVKASLKAAEVKLGIQFDRKRTKPYSYSSSYLMSCTITLGEEFKLRIFQDYDNLEVNTTPYRYDQTFSINDRESKPVYWFLQQFVFSIADELKLKRVSGHKHIDIKNSLCGNVELLARMIVDSQNQAFFPVLLKRMNCEDSFRYNCNEIYLSKYGSFPRLIHFIVDAINSQLKSQETCLLDQGFRATVEFVTMLKEVFIESSDKYVVCNLLHINSDNLKKSIDIPPSTTLEFRVMQAPRNADECELINRMYIDWFKSLRKNQLDNAFLEYNPRDPKYYSNDPDLAIKHFKEFLQKIKSTITDEESEKLIHCTH